MNLAFNYILIFSIFFRVRVLNHSSFVTPPPFPPRQHQNKGVVFFVFDFGFETIHTLYTYGSSLVAGYGNIVPRRQCLERTRLPPLDA